MTGENSSEGWSKYLPFVAILFLSGSVRFYNLMNPFNFPGNRGVMGNNGIDEGVFLMTGRLMSKGYGLYSDVNTQQGPLFSFLIELLNGDPLMVRSMTVVLSLAGILGLILFAGGTKDRRTAIAASMFLAFNYMYFKESRHVSFDLYSTVLLTLGFTSFFLFFRNSGSEKKVEDGRRTITNLSLLCLAGVLLSFSAMSKLFAVIPIFSLGFYMLSIIFLDRFRPERSGLTVWHVVLLVTSTILPTVLIMSIYGFENTFNGMFLENLDRPVLLLSERIETISHFLFFTSAPLVLSFVAIKREWRERKVQLMLVWALPLFILLIFMPLMWEHYFVLIVPPVSYLGGRGLAILLEDRRAVIKEPKIDRGKGGRSPGGLFTPTLIGLGVIFLLVSLSIETCYVFATEKALEREIAEDVRLLTDKEDFIISGDPIIGVYAGRYQPPGATNIAKVRYPPLTDEDLINTTLNYDVELVIFTYQLSNYEGYIDFIKENYEFYRSYSRTEGSSNIEGEISIDKSTFTIYVQKTHFDGR